MYLYDLHQHTKDGSLCGIDDPVSIVRALSRDGWAGCVLTDHFIHGNTRVRRNMAWEDIVRAYERSYEAAYEEGQRLDFDVLFGIEEGIGDCKEALIYGLTPQFLYDHPEIRDGDLPHLSRIVREAGGFFVQAHPFRVRDYIPRPWEALDPDLFDGVEIYNACNPPLDNLRAVQWAANNDLPPIAGSDRHYMGHCENFGILVDRRIRTEAELAQVLMEGDYSLNTPGV